MINKFRLSANVYERENDKERENVQKIIFLSVEGNKTEKEYFEGISRYRERLGITSKVDVEVLKRHRKDTNSAPQQVVELLEEYLRLREIGDEDLVKEIPKEFVEHYGIQFIKNYLENPNNIPKHERNEFNTELQKIGYNASCRKYLRKYNHNLDEFAILIDRDVQTHSEVNMESIVSYCRKKKYQCYIANPCFEFWLLLHLSDVKIEYSKELDKIKENAKVSKSHTFVSKEVSNKVNHGKRGIHFERNYLPYVDTAIDRAKNFSSDEFELIHNIGCNIWKMLENMKKFI